MNFGVKQIGLSRTMSYWEKQSRCTSGWRHLRDPEYSPHLGRRPLRPDTAVQRKCSSNLIGDFSFMESTSECPPTLMVPFRTCHRFSLDLAKPRTLIEGEIWIQVRNVFMAAVAWTLYFSTRLIVLSRDDRVVHVAFSARIGDCVKG